MTGAEAKHLLETDPNFIYSKRFDYSLEKLLERYPEGAPLRVIAQVMMMTEDDLEEMEQQIIEKVRQNLGIEIDCD